MFNTQFLRLQFAIVPTQVADECAVSGGTMIQQRSMPVTKKSVSAYILD
jgi:hypothetical protein